MSITKRMRILSVSALFGLAILVANMSISHAISYAWSTPVNLQANGTNHKMAISEDGQHQVAIWSGQPHASMSHDGGATWSTPVALADNTSTAELPQITISDDGLTSTAVWRRRGGDGIYQMMTSSTTDGGASWSTPHALSPVEASLFRFNIDASADGSQATVTWGHNEPGSGKARVKAISSQDAGMTWGSVASFAPLGFNSSDIDPDVNVSDDGSKVSVAWTGAINADKLFRYSTSQNGGTTWSTPTAIYTTPNAIDRSVAFNSSSDNSKQTITWIEFSTLTPSNKSIKTISSSNNGTTWGTPATGATGANIQALNTTLSGDGNKLVSTWIDGPAFNQLQIMANVSSDSGATWSTPAVIQTALSVPQIEVSPPKAAVSSDGSKMTIIWGSPAKYSISTDGGNNWSASASAVTGEPQTKQVEILSNGSGSSFVALWLQSINSGPFSIHTSKLESPDNVAPIVNGVPDRSANSLNWYNASVTIDWQATDPEPSSGQATDPPDTIADQEGTHTYTSEESCDPAGNCSTGSMEISIDTVKPTITFNGNSQTYGLADTIEITCQVSDETSGIATSECPEISGPAYEYLGSNTLNAFASDKADNANMAAASFTVAVQASDLQTLIDQLVDSPTLANTLGNKITAMDNAPSIKACNGMLNGFTGLVNAQTPTSISAENAELLIALAGELCN